MLLKKLRDKKLISPPSWLIENTIYLTRMGSLCYGCENENSDNDIYGICIPQKHVIFPHLAGEIIDFGIQTPRFHQWERHHVFDDSCNKSYDFCIYSIVKYFDLLMKNNPNIVDSLFVEQNFIIHITQIGNLLRENRKLFLHKGAWFKFKGYAYSQLHKIKIKNPVGDRLKTVKKYGYDVKYAYHLVRLLNEVEQILIEGDLNLMRNKEQLKAIRSGEWTLQQIEDYFTTKERELESLYTSSSLQHYPDEKAIKRLLLQCLEMHYGSLEKAINVSAINEKQILLEIHKLCEKTLNT